MKRAAFPTLFILALVAAGCNGSSTPPADGPQGAVPNFALMDVNPTSTTFNQAVSPRDYTSRTTGWYFGSAT